MMNSVSEEFLPLFLSIEVLEGVVKLFDVGKESIDEEGGAGRADLRGPFIILLVSGFNICIEGRFGD